jgi:predicted amidohydrolase
MDAIDLICERVAECEKTSVEILCCPEAILGGLADYAASPNDIAIHATSGQLETVLAPLASETVTVICGFTELGEKGLLYNSAAIFHKGSVLGVYRKLHPAIRKSIYQPGDQTPVFTVGGLTFGIAICNDSNFEEPARVMASRGATVLFVPSNNGLPAARPSVVAASRKADVARAAENTMWVIRADVTGRAGDFVSPGSSGIVDPAGTLVRSAEAFTTCLLMAEVDT